MDTTAHARGGLSGYRSRIRVLAEWFRQSRDNWKQKYMELKREIKRFKNRACDLEKSRDHWKQQASVRSEEIDVLHAEFEQLKRRLEGMSSDEKSKKNARMADGLRG